MRIAVTSTISWPYIRRGNRCSYELAVYLAAQGHDVTFITLKPGEIPREEYKDGLRIEYHTIKEKPLLSLISHYKLESFVPTCINALMRGNYDLIQTTFPIDAYSASIVKRLKGTPFVHMIYDCNPLHHPAKFGRHMFKTVVNNAGQLVAISDFVNDHLEKEYGIRGESIPLPVDTEQFTPCTTKDLSRPRILFTASLLEKRKRGGLLILAFEKLLEHRPEAILQLSGHTNDFVAKTIFSMVNKKTRKAIRLESIGALQDLPSLYQQAAISVLPSLNEAFGLVINESLACGTPVVGTRSGAIPDIIDDPAIGVLFEKTDGPEEVCQALLKALTLAENPTNWQRCRAHVEKRYTWKTIGPQYEAIYDRLVKYRPARKRKSKKKVRGPFQPIKPLPETLPTDTEGLTNIFIDTLDEQKITYDTYYEIDSQRPRCVAIAVKLIRQGISNGRMLIVSSDSRPNTIYFSRLGYKISSMSVAEETENWRNPENLVSPDAMSQSIEELGNDFDIILFDALIQSIPYPLETIRLLGKKLKTGGHLLISCRNPASGANRLHLLFGNNIYPAPLKGRVSTCRYYSLDELDYLLTCTDFTFSDGQYIIGQKAITDVFSWFHLPMKKFVVRKGYQLFQKVFPYLRGYLYVIGRKQPVRLVD